MALRVIRSIAVDVRAPVRSPGLCAGAVGGLPPPPPPPPPPPGLVDPTAAATETPRFNVAVNVSKASSFAVAPGAVVGDDGRLVAAMLASEAVAAGAGEAILWSRNPRAAPSTFGKHVPKRGYYADAEVVRDPLNDFPTIFQNSAFQQQRGRKI